MQRAILDVLSTAGSSKSIERLTQCVCHREYFWRDPDQCFDYNADYQAPPPKRSEIVAIHAAVKALERRGLVVTKKREARGRMLRYGGLTRWLEVQIVGSGERDVGDDTCVRLGENRTSDFV